MCQVNIVDLLIIYINLLKLRTKVLVEFTYEIIYNPIKVTNLFSCCSWLIPTTTLGGVIRHGWRCARCRVETLSTVRQKQNRQLIKMHYNQPRQKYILRHHLFNLAELKGSSGSSETTVPLTILRPNAVPLCSRQQQLKDPL